MTTAADHRPVPRLRRRLLVPEIVQSSEMDCGPAALQALLAGFDISVSYSRLREACRTTVDGTSIDTIEELACALGLRAEQVMLPADFVTLPESEALPAVIVTRLPGGATHFVVLWSRVLDWLQVMDPAVGRRWIHVGRLPDELYLHQQAVPRSAWQEWTASDGFRAPLLRLMRGLGIAAPRAAALLAPLDGDDWLVAARLDAAVRMTGALLRCGAVQPGDEAARTVLQLTAADARPDEDDTLRIPARYWSVLPAPADDNGEAQALLRGAVLVRVDTSAAGPTPAPSPIGALTDEALTTLRQTPDSVWHVVRQVLLQDGIRVPVLAAAALLTASFGVLLQSLLVQGLLTMTSMLPTAELRFSAAAAVLLLLTALTVLQLPLSRTLQRAGLRLELRLRATLMMRLARLSDRFFHSRLTSDMAQRAHSLQLLRRLPEIAGALLTQLFQLLLTTAAIGLLFPQSLITALAATAGFLGASALNTALLNEGDLRLRAHSAGLNRFTLDALRGLVPLRTHSAERAFRREHERLLTEWMRAGLRLIRLDVTLQLTLSLLYTGFAIRLLNDFLAGGGAQSTALLLLFWTLNLPVIAQSLLQQLQQLPVLRNTLQRVVEPLQSADEEPELSAHVADHQSGVRIQLQSVQVQAAGQTILHDLDLDLAPGEHVAVVGPSGAGKSTLVGLLLGWHQPAAGTLLVDEQPLIGAQLAALRRTTAWVDPAVQLWNRSLFENLSYGSTAGSGLPLAAADLLPLVERLEQGLQTVLGEGGGLVSGGEGQRVRFARALQRTAVRLAILDEPFRGLDRSQRRLLLQRARAAWPHATLLCVTHDIAETLEFPRVLVIDHGRLVEDGVPALLAAADTRYAALLAAERSNRAWADTVWRRLRLDDGVLSDVTRPS